MTPSRRRRHWQPEVACSCVQGRSLTPAQRHPDENAAALTGREALAGKHRCHWHPETENSAHHVDSDLPGSAAASGTEPAQAAVLMGGPQAAPAPAEAAAAPGRCACWAACLPGLSVTAWRPQAQDAPGPRAPWQTPSQARSRRAPRRLLPSPLKLTCQRPQARCQWPLAVHRTGLALQWQ